MKLVFVMVLLLVCSCAKPNEPREVFEAVRDNCKAGGTISVSVTFGQWNDSTSIVCTYEVESRDK